MSARKRIVVKIGSSLLADQESLALRYSFIHGVLTDIAKLQSEGWDVVLASSGAVALGLKEIGKTPESADMVDKQAAAACGQPLLMNAYRQMGHEHGLSIAQVLVTMTDMETRRSFLNTRNTLLNLFDRGIVPIVNENDTVTAQELKVGDNDRLAAKVAQMVQADHLVLLTNVDGLYTCRPDLPGAELVEMVEDVSQYLAVTQSTGALGSGGMLTKMQAANMAQAAGCTTLIARGISDRPVTGVLDYSRKHTRCRAFGTPQSSWKVWLTNRLQVAGSVVITDSAQQRLQSRGGDVMPEDIMGLHGDFLKGDVIHLFSEAGDEIARGLTNYSSDETLLMARHGEEKVVDLMGPARVLEKRIVNHDNMVMISDNLIPWDAPEDAIETVEIVGS